jgi:hypothetical protein
VRVFRLDRSPVGYGSSLYIGERVRIGSRNTMTPMWPHIYKGGDQNCNDVLSFHLYPIVSIDIWWRRKQRTWRDGLCETCKQELREDGWSEEAIDIHNNALMRDGAFYEDHRENLKDSAYRDEYMRELRDLLDPSRAEPVNEG